MSAKGSSDGSAEQSDQATTSPAKWGLLGVIVLVALIRGLYWVAITEVPNPIDEIHHLGYIDSLATGNGIPKVGEDFLPRAILQLMRDSPTFGSRGLPLDPDEPQEWGASAHQYESVQPAFYYAIMVPAYRAGGLWGVSGSLYAVRIASLLLALITIPLAWLLARELFPRHPEVWLFSALLLAVLQGFNANTASVTNDTLVLPLATLSALAIARSLHRMEWRRALLCGLFIGLTLLAKLNAIALIPVLGIALLLVPRDSDRSLWWRLRWGGLATTAAIIVVFPWFAWNLYAYGKLSGGSDAAANLLASLQVTYPFTLQGVKSHLTESMSGFWQFQRFSPRGPGDYGWIFVAATATGTTGILASLITNRKDQAARLGWLATCWPLAFLSMLSIVYLAYTGTIVGRHTYPALAPLLIFVAGGLIFGLGRHLGTVALAILIAGALWVEQAEYKNYLNSVYLEHVVIEGVAPEWDQPFTMAWVETEGLWVDSSCPVVSVGLGLRDTAPKQILIDTDSRTLTAPLIAGGEGISLYLLEEPYPTRFTIGFSPPLMMGSDAHLAGPIHFAEGDPNQSPMAQIQCRMADWEQSRFDQRFSPFHLDQISYSLALGWGRGWAIIGLLFALTVTGTQIWAAIRPERRSDQEDTATASPKP